MWDKPVALTPIAMLRLASGLCDWQGGEMGMVLTIVSTTCSSLSLKLDT